MFVGEAPGEQEDRRGEPFVGPAGELLDKMIDAMGWTREAVYIANTVKCRPPGNRDPEADELAACKPFLDAQLDSVAPRIIVALGRPAAQQLLDTNAPISKLRGKFHDRRGVLVMPTFHPAYLLRSPERKRDTWDDLKLVMAELARIGVVRAEARAATSVRSAASVRDAVSAEIALDPPRGRASRSSCPGTSARSRARTPKGGRRRPRRCSRDLASTPATAREAIEHDDLADRGFALLRLVAPIVIEDDPAVAAARARTPSWPNLAELTRARDAAARLRFGRGMIELAHLLHGGAPAGVVEPEPLGEPVAGWHQRGPAADAAAIRDAWQAIAARLGVAGQRARRSQRPGAAARRSSSSRASRS